jgi:hypothetical protein
MSEDLGPPPRQSQILKKRAAPRAPRPAPLIRLGLLATCNYMYYLLYCISISRQSKKQIKSHFHQSLTKHTIVIRHQHDINKQACLQSSITSRQST